MRPTRFAMLSTVGVLLASTLTAQEAPRLHHQERPEASPILAEYDFERPSPSGPDTFWIRQQRGGEVALSNAFRVSGRRSLHITEVPGNRDFAEFLAYFRECTRGKVFIQFYLLLTDPEQRFNFGLAGRNWFLSPKRHGHAIWLQTDDGVLRHKTFEGWEQLFAPRPFAWYFVDFVYDVDAGEYDLAIFEEGLAEPVVDLRAVRGTNGHDRSSVRYYSLIGDLEDAGRFDFFVDDLVIATDPAVVQKPFVAPGRREFFVDSLDRRSHDRIAVRPLDDLLWLARQWLDRLAGDPAEVDEDLPRRLEAAADEAFRAGDLDFAEEAYTELGRDPERSVRMMLKLADVSFLRGDVEGERGLRESIYGRLDVER